jgi:hypothetical protein
MSLIQLLIKNLILHNFVRIVKSFMKNIANNGKYVIIHTHYFENNYKFNLFVSGS